jgi:hypothetical protein
MFTSLEQFYNSDEWKATRAKIINDRADEYGRWADKPITEYDTYDQYRGCGD